MSLKNVQDKIVTYSIKFSIIMLTLHIDCGKIFSR